MKPTLVVLAAGMGSRYGGLKQIDRIGKGGETLLDYSVYDALRNGFGSVVFIIRQDIEKDFRKIVLNRMRSSVEYDLAFQELDSLLRLSLQNTPRGRGGQNPGELSMLCSAPRVLLTRRSL
jgi:CTP:molybdopterin cytidylyltransferase MocA